MGVRITSNNKDYSSLGSTLGSPYLGKLPHGLAKKAAAAPTVSRFGKTAAGNAKDGACIEYT